MANIQERRDKSGKLISYSIRVHRGRGADGKQLKPWTATFDVSPTWTEKSARKRAAAFAATFEKECREGVTSDSRQRFADYCNYVLELKEARGAKHLTIVRYKELTTRIYPAVGHVRLKDLRASHLNNFYSELLKPGVIKGATHATSKVDLPALLKKKGLTRVAIAEQSNIPLRAVYAAVNGEKATKEAATAISVALGLPLEKVFAMEESTRTLSAKTVLEYHRLISTVLDQAEKEGLVPFNVASKTTLPKVEHKEISHFEPEEVAAIREALESESIKWRTLTHLLLITGARRGEILGLKWSEVDFEGNRIHICNNVLYSPDVGIYEDTPKTERSKRYISLPVETMQLLRQYRVWQNEERLRLGEYYQYQGFVFSKDNGGPMHPGSVTDWLNKFSKRHDLPHINPHAFRHTMASMLYFNGVDSVSISKRLGHSKVSITADIYAHVMEDADKRNADILSEVFLGGKTSTG
jgi:integrase